MKAQYRAIKPEIDAAIASVLESSQFILGNEVRAFEEEFAAYCDAAHCIAVNSGTSALHLALLAAGIGPGHEVIVPPYTFVATVAAVRYTGATPVFVDIDPRNYTMDAAQVEKAIGPRTRAIIPVHLYGQPAEMDSLLDIARRHRLTVIEDAAQAHGAEYRGRRVGAIGDLGCFSFYPAKNLGAYGEGGAVVTNRPDYAHTIRLLRSWGEEKRYHHILRGYNYRMEGLQGAILRVKLRYLPAWTEARRRHAAVYARLFAGSAIVAPAETPCTRHVYCVYAIRTPSRGRVVGALEAARIGCAIHYPVGIHELEAHADLGYHHGDFPAAESMAAEQLSLPIYPELTEGQIETVVDTVVRAAG